MFKIHVMRMLEVYLLYSSVSMRYENIFNAYKVACIVYVHKVTHRIFLHILVQNLYINNCPTNNAINNVFTISRTLMLVVTIVVIKDRTLEQMSHFNYVGKRDKFC